MGPWGKQNKSWSELKDIPWGQGGEAKCASDNMRPEGLGFLGSLERWEKCWGRMKDKVGTWWE